MISKVINGKEYLFVEVPENGREFYLDEDQYIWYKEETVTELILDFDAPDGYWEIIGKASELTEEQWKGVVENEDNRFYDYVLFRGHLQNYFDTATESGLSLISSIGMKPETTLIILKQ